MSEIKLSEKALLIEPNSYYEHFKGMQYKVLSVARHSETLEEYVVYQALYGEMGIWIRPLAMFLESVEVKGEKKPRFKKIEREG
jgi:hypothetical protein